MDALTARVNLLSKSIEDFQLTTARLCSHIEALGAKIDATLSRSASTSSLESVELLSSPATPSASNLTSRMTPNHVSKPALGQKIICFSGMANQLSNLFKTNVIHGGRLYTSSEQAIQFGQS